MQDRIPGAPGQYKAVLSADDFQKMQAGEQFTITMIRDDRPIVKGTPYSKAAVLPDALAEKLCPDIQDPTPADALEALLSRNGTTPMKADLPMGGFRVTEVGAPAADGDAVNFKFVKDNFRPNTWTPTAAEVGAAPAEFINHAFATNGDVTDLLLIDGTQYGSGNKPMRINVGDVTTLTNRPAGFPTSGPYIGHRTVDWYETNRFVVTVYEAYPVSGRIWVNHFNVSAWDGWCCVAESVPMIPGVEYCTTKMYNGAPVYTRKLSDVLVPAGQFVEATTGVDHSHLASYTAMMRNGNYAMAEMLPYHNYLGNLLANVRQTANGIAIDNFDTEDFSAEIYIEYWK